MFYRLRDRIMRRRFNRACAGILRTPPVEPAGEGVRVVTMVSHKDLLMYLVAIKSFYRRLGKGRISVVNDGSLSREDKSVLESHLPGITIADVADISTGSCPTGGCWERLMYICNQTNQEYVIQLDADTVTTGAIPEIVECIDSNRSFTMLGGGAREKVVSFEEFSRDHQQSTSAHVQAVAQRNMHRVEQAQSLQYVQGNAAFAGFAKSSAGPEKVQDLSSRMQDVCGAQKWSQWGSEQVMSNIVVANSSDPYLLPSRKYLGYYPSRDIDYTSEPSLIHFIGTHRFDNGLYIQLSRQFIDQCEKSKEEN